MVNTYKIMIPIEDILENFEEDCTYNNLSAEQWANQAEELEKELNLYKYMAKIGRNLPFPRIFSVNSIPDMIEINMAKIKCIFLVKIFCFLR